MYSKQRKDPLESAIQRKIIKRYEAAGCMVIKMGLTNKPGFPDLMILKDGKASFIEVKRPGAEPRPLQEYRINELRKAGFCVEVLTE